MNLSSEFLKFISYNFEAILNAPVREITQPYLILYYRLYYHNTNWRERMCQYVKFIQLI